jgi:hypothetical protein
LWLSLPFLPILSEIPNTDILSLQAMAESWRYPTPRFPPQKNSKVIIDITSDEKSGRVLKGCDRAALILNQYTQASAGIEHGFKMAVTLHGAATKAALSHEAYAKHATSYMKNFGEDAESGSGVNLKAEKKHGLIFTCAEKPRR